MLRLTDIKVENFIGTHLECDGNGDGKYGRTIEKWIASKVFGIEHNTGEGPDIINGGWPIEIKSQREDTNCKITLTSLTDKDLRGYDNWSDDKKEKVNSDILFVRYRRNDGLIEITDITVILRKEYTDWFVSKINNALMHPNKVCDGVIVETGNHPRLRITQDRLRKDIVRNSSKARNSTIDRLFEPC